ncbi:MAG: AIR carboxylase family protein [Spirochaetales bacterium]|jgi:phosphoribosylaminoimidazole carboxylase PurE protein|nr:AIR carboxylase family protein [Spirochaetales bacterium]
MKDILFIIGSESDREAAAPGLALMKEKGLEGDLAVYSAHRNLPALSDFLKENSGAYRVIIAAAGLSAALPGIVASLCANPVIGVPLVSGPLAGIDALLSILQLPKGVPVATMGIGGQGVLNAVHLAERIIKAAG